VGIVVVYGFILACAGVASLSDTWADQEYREKTQKYWEERHRKGVPR
jgi:hypothetical protein